MKSKALIIFMVMAYGTGLLSLNADGGKPKAQQRRFIEDAL